MDDSLPALLPELLALIRALLPTCARFQSKRVCRAWNTGEALDKGFHARPYVSYARYKLDTRRRSMLVDPWPWRAHQALLVEWIEAGGLKWKPAELVYPSVGKGVLAVLFFAIYVTPCPLDGQHIFRIQGRRDHASTATSWVAVVNGCLHCSPTPWGYTPSRYVRGAPTLRELLTHVPPAWLIQSAAPAWNDPVVLEQLKAVKIN